jgi:hypothetical protein
MAQLARRSVSPPPRPRSLTSGAHWSSPPSRRPQAGLVFESDRATAVRVRPEHASSTWPARQEVRPGLFKAAATAPGPPTRDTRRPPPLAPHLAETLAAAAFGFPPSTPPHRQGAHPETHKEVRNPPASLVVVFVHRSNRGTSPDFSTLAEPCRRAERPRRRVSAETAALDCLAASRASRGRNPCFNSCTGTLVWGPAGELRRPTSLAAAVASPPTAASARMRPTPPDRDPADQIQSRRPQATVSLGSRSNGSRSSRPKSASQTPPALAVLRKTPQVFRYSQKYPPP